VDDVTLEKDEENALIVSGWWIYIPSLDLYIREGVSCFVFRVSCFVFRVSCFVFRVSCFVFRVSCAYDEEEKVYSADFSVTVVMVGENHEDGYLYYEQDGLVISLANYLKGKIGLDDIEALACELHIPDVTAAE